MKKPNWLKLLYYKLFKKGIYDLNNYRNTLVKITDDYSPTVTGCITYQQYSIFSSKDLNGLYYAYWNKDGMLCKYEQEGYHNSKL